MKIRIEAKIRDTQTLPFSVVWTDGKTALGTLNARDKKTWQPAVDALLAQPEKSKGLDSDIYRNKENILAAARLPRKGGLDRSENVRLAAGSALDSRGRFSIMPLRRIDVPIVSGTKSVPRTARPGDFFISAAMGAARRTQASIPGLTGGGFFFAPGERRKRRRKPWKRHRCDERSS